MSASNHLKGPGWPDVRGWAVIGFFALTFYALYMIDKNPELLSNASFMQFIQALSTGGILLVAGNLFGGTKSGAETTARITQAATTNQLPQSPVEGASK